MPPGLAFNASNATGVLSGPNGGTGIANLRFSLPSRINAAAVMASPPTLVTGTTTSFSASILTSSITTTTLTVGTVSSGAVNIGESVSGAGVTAGTYITANISGTGAGSTWTVNNSQTVASETMTLAPQFAWQNASLAANFLNTEKFSLSRGYFNVSKAGTTNFPELVSATNGLGSTPNVYETGQVAFLWDGQNLEFNVVCSGSFYKIKVDDAYISATPTACTSTFYMMKFSSRALRRIDIIGGQLNLNQVAVGITDTVYRAPIRGARVIGFGDSMSNNAGSSYGFLGIWVNILADYMGWDDARSSGIGGTGYTNTNLGMDLTFVQRVPYDICPYAPGAVIFFGSINDASSTPASVAAAAHTAWTAVKSCSPGTVIFQSLNASGGVGTISSNYWGIHDALNVQAIADGVITLDLLQAPLQGTPDTATLNNNVSAAGTTLPLNSAGSTTSPVYGGCYRIGSVANSNLEEMQILGYTSGNRIYTLYDPLRYAHSSGDTITRVGCPLWTGHGNAQTPTGLGNSDLYVNTDGIHPTDAGENAIAQALVGLMYNALASFPN